MMELLNDDDHDGAGEAQHHVQEEQGQRKPIRRTSGLFRGDTYHPNHHNFLFNDLFLISWCVAGPSITGVARAALQPWEGDIFHSSCKTFANSTFAFFCKIGSLWHSAVWKWDFPVHQQQSLFVACNFDKDPITIDLNGNASTDSTHRAQVCKLLQNGL